MNPMRPLFLFLIFVITSSIANEQDPLGDAGSGSLHPSSEDNATVMPSSTANDDPSIVPPSAAPQTAISYTKMPTLAPEAQEDQFSTCTNDPDWFFAHQYVAGWAKEIEIRGCDDDSVQCCHKGNLGLARDYCCKCKPADYECIGDPDDDGFPIAMQVLTCVSFVFVTLFSFKVIRVCELRQIRQTMAARRQQQNDQGVSEEERDGRFVASFYFQEVLPDKSNTTVHGLRRSSIKLGEDNHYDEEKTKTDVANGDDDSVVPEVAKESCSDQPLSRRLSNWRKPAPKDECCICLDCYSVGEIICAPMKTECIHVFHEGCMHEWVKRGNDKCPLCRVDILKD